MKITDPDGKVVGENADGSVRLYRRFTGPHVTHEYILFRRSPAPSLVDKLLRWISKGKWSLYHCPNTEPECPYAEPRRLMLACRYDCPNTEPYRWKAVGRTYDPGVAGAWRVYYQIEPLPPPPPPLAPRRTIPPA